MKDFRYSVTFHAVNLGSVLALVKPHECGFFQGRKVQVETNDRGHDIGGEFQLSVYCMYVEKIAMGVTALGGTRAAISGCAKVRTRL